MNTEDQLAKALEDLKTERERNAKAIQQLETTVQITEEKDKRIQHQKIALEAYTQEVKKLQNQQQSELAEEEKYLNYKAFVEEQEILIGIECKKLVKQHFAECENRIKFHTAELATLDNEKPIKLLSPFKFKAWEEEYDTTKQNLNFAESDVNFPPFAGLENTAWKNLCSQKEAPEIAMKELQTAKIFIMKYEMERIGD